MLSPIQSDYEYVFIWDDGAGVKKTSGSYNIGGDREYFLSSFVHGSAMTATFDEAWANVNSHDGVKRMFFSEYLKPTLIKVGFLILEEGSNSPYRDDRLLEEIYGTVEVFIAKD